MSMIDRYRKTGGFNQLLNLLETTGPAKREKFLEMIRAEDSVWADEILKKMIDMQKILSWPQEALAEILPTIPEPVWGAVLHGLQDDQKNKLYEVMTHSVRRKIDDHYNSSKPNAAELSALYMRIITDVRNMISSGKLHVKKFDPTLFVDDDIEEKLKKGAEAVVAAKVDTILDESPLNFDIIEKNHSKADSVSSEEYQILRKKTFALQQENQELKNEISRLTSKLTQVKKLVA